VGGKVFKRYLIKVCWQVQGIGQVLSNGRSQVQAVGGVELSQQ